MGTFWRNMIMLLSLQSLRWEVGTGELLRRAVSFGI